MKQPQRPSWNANLFLPFVPPGHGHGWRHGVGLLLGKMGPTWRCAPVRRVTQMLCLGLFGYLFFYVAWPYAAVFTGKVLEDKEWLPVEVFLWLDPLVGLTTAVAARHWNVALLGLGGVLLVCLLFPRGFCGYLCPLGTLIDGFDWLIGRRITRLRVQRPGGWAHLRYYLLTAVLVGALGGVLLSGYVAAIPVLMRGLLFTGGRLQLGLMKGWSQVAPATWNVYLSLLLFATVFLLGLLGKRFWCRYVCPSGAVFSVFSLLRIGERKVEASCVHCGKCRAVCPFDAIREDDTTRTLDCSFCQTCGGACPTHAIKFVPRWNRDRLKEPNQPPAIPCSLSRRGLLASGVAGVGAALSAHPGPARAVPPKIRLLRPPGSVPEPEFLDLCIRCGECFKVCPGPVLQPAGLEAGWEALWTPVVVPSHAGCHQDCNFCTQVCPTHAIRPLSLTEKRRTALGLAVVNTTTCLPHAGQRDCRLCFEECEAAGYHAIQMRPIQLALGDIPPGVVSEAELEAMGTIEAPFVDPDACTGCGLCEYRCHTTHVKQAHVLSASAIRVVPR
ncbi:MAG: 4Fe-4S binding protein [Planctomycetes bacterium]|nr:4Fe-4S binding protein [Planctomycetota bacterium]